MAIDGEVVLDSDPNEDEEGATEEEPPPEEDAPGDDEEGEEEIRRPPPVVKVVAQEEEEEEELVDPQDTAKETCGESGDCAGYKAKLDACNERLSGSESEETCEEELFDFLHCVDTCVSKNLFQQLK